MNEQIKRIFFIILWVKRCDKKFFRSRKKDIIDVNYMS